MKLGNHYKGRQMCYFTSLWFKLLLKFGIRSSFGEIPKPVYASFVPFSKVKLEKLVIENMFSTFLIQFHNWPYCNLTVQMSWHFFSIDLESSMIYRVKASYKT